VAVAQIDTTNHVFLPMGLIPPGMVTPFAGAAAPSGWLLCYGQAISRTTYAALFAVVGTTYGAGDGSTTFNVPDMRGSLPMGLDNMGGTAANRVTEAVSGVASATLGGRGGDERLHAHSHGISDPGHVHQQRANDGGSNLDGNLHNPNSNQNGRYADCNTGSSVTGISIQNAGSGGAQNMPPVLALNYIIKT
jgi:microcystin-dependent protein